MVAQNSSHSTGFRALLNLILAMAAMDILHFESDRAFDYTRCVMANTMSRRVIARTRFLKPCNHQQISHSDKPIPKQSNGNPHDTLSNRA